MSMDLVNTESRTMFMDVRVKNKETLQYLVEALTLLEDQYFAENRDKKGDVKWLKNEFEKLLYKWRQ